MPCYVEVREDLTAAFDPDALIFAVLLKCDKCDERVTFDERVDHVLTRETPVPPAQAALIAACSRSGWYVGADGISSRGERDNVTGASSAKALCPACYAIDERLNKPLGSVPVPQSFQYETSIALDADQFRHLFFGGALTVTNKISGQPASIKVRLVGPVQSVEDLAKQAARVGAVADTDEDATVPGSVFWYAYLATNADRIYVNETVALAALPADAQCEWVRYWLEEKLTPRVRSSINPEAVVAPKPTTTKV